MKPEPETGDFLNWPRLRLPESASNCGVDQACIRPICALDRQKFLEFFKNLSPTTNALRFLALKTTISDEELTYLTEPDCTQHVALVAVLTVRGKERIVAAARFIAVPDVGRSSERAELAVTVADEFQGKGIGTRLALHLLPLARECGIRILDLYTSPGNHRIWKMVRCLSHRATRTVEDGVVHITYPLP